MRLNYSYFVSYSYEDESGTHFGNLEIKTNDLVFDMDAVAVFEGYISKNLGFKNVVVMNYILLKKL